MKKQIFISTIFVTLSIILATWLPCHAEEGILYGCAKNKSGNFRIVSDHSQCKKSEYPVTLNGSALSQNPLPKFNGEICLELSVTEEKDGPRDEPLLLPLQTHINYMGKHYLVSGYVDIPPPMNPMVISGSAVVIGDKIIISSIFTFDEPFGMEQTGAILEMRLDKTTLGGSFWIVGNDFEKDTRQSHFTYGAGTVTKKTSCP